MSSKPPTPTDRLADISGVLIDIDDTLVDNKHAIRHAISAIAGAYLPSETDIDEAAAFFREDRHGHYRAYARGEIGSCTQRWMRAQDLHDHFGGAPLKDEAAAAPWIDAFDAAYAAGWRIHDDSVAFLARLDALGLPYGLLSNARRAQQVAKLAAVGLSAVPLLVCVDDFGYAKPDPRIFLQACTLLGTEPSRTVYVGDEFDIDAGAAVRAGLVGVWCDRPGAWERWRDADAEASGALRVESLAELARLLGPRSTP